MNTEATVVTCLFYLENQLLFNKHNHHYKTWAKNILSLNSFLVIYTDEYYYSFVKKQRECFDPGLLKTRLIKTSIKELRCYGLYNDSIESILHNHRLSALGIQWNSTYYNLIILSKMDMLYQTSILNPFNTDYFCWLDMGGVRYDIDHWLKWPVIPSYLDDRLLVFDVSSKKINILNKKHYADTHAAMIQGAVFLGNRHSIERINRVFYLEVENCLNESFVATEQKIFDFCNSLYPEMFMVINANTIVSNISNVWFRFFDFLK